MVIFGYAEPDVCERCDFVVGLLEMLVLSCVVISPLLPNPIVVGVAIEAEITVCVGTCAEDMVMQT